jgi:hypothetical protein
MTHLLDRDRIDRAEAAVVISMVTAAFATCVIASVAYDISSWLGG